MRPPQRLFNYEEVLKVYGRKNIVKQNQAYVFQNDTYKDGFVEKDFKMSVLIMDDVNPTLDKITQFTRRQDGGDDHVINLLCKTQRGRIFDPGFCQKMKDFWTFFEVFLTLFG